MCINDIAIHHNFTCHLCIEFDYIMKQIDTYRLSIIFSDGHSSCYPNVYNFINDEDVIRFKIWADNFRLEYYIPKNEIEDFDIRKNRKKRDLY